MHKWLNYLLFGSKAGRVSPSRGRIDPKKLDQAGRLLKSMSGTIVRFLQAAQEQVLNVPSLQPAYFRKELQKAIRRYQGELSPEDEAALGKKTMRLIMGQHEREREYLSDREEELRAIISFITTEIEGTAAEGESFSKEMSATLGELESAVEIEDVRQVRERIAQHVGQIAQHVELKLRREEDRIQNLEEQVELLSAKTDLTSATEHTDELTALYSREAFDREIRSEVSLAKRLRRPLTLILFDLDRFELANETFGQEACDQVLMQMAERLIREFFRKNDFLARYGGEEFAVILPDEKVAAATKAAERLREGLLNRPIAIDDREITLTISAGVTQYVPGESGEQFVARAEEALGRAKDAGYNRVIASAA